MSAGIAPEYQAHLLKFNVDQAARYCQRHPDTLRRDAAAGELHGSQRKKSGKWMFDRVCLDAYLAGKKCAHQLAEDA